MYRHDTLKEVKRLSFNSTGSQFHAQGAKENALSTTFINLCMSRLQLMDDHKDDQEPAVTGQHQQICEVFRRLAYKQLVPVLILDSLHNMKLK